MIKAIIFDMDGVLVGNEGVGFLADNVTLAHWNTSISEDDYKQVAGRSIHTRIPLFEKMFGIKIDLEEFSAIFIPVVLKILEKEIIASKDTVQAVFQKARERGFKIAVATSARKGKVDGIIDGLDVRGYLNSLVTADDIADHKPHPGVYLESAKRLGLTPDECVVVEDSPVGIEAGKRAGMQVLGFKTSKFTLEELSAADIMISNLDEVLDHVG